MNWGARTIALDEEDSRQVTIAPYTSGNSCLNLVDA